MFDNTPPWPAFVLVRRELLQLGRNGKLFALLALFTAFLTGITAFSAGANEHGSGSTAAFGLGVFRSQFYLLYLSAIIVAPMLGASAVVYERKQECFPLVYLSLIPPGWIVWSKFLAILGVFLGLYVGILPFQGLVYFFAGVETAALFQAMLALVSLAAATTAIGIMASAWSKDYGRAQSHAGCFVFLLLVAPWLLQVTIELLGYTAPVALTWIRHNTVFRPTGTLPSVWEPILTLGAWHLLVAAIALGLARYRVVPRRESRLARLRPSRIVPRRKLTFAPMPDGANPIEFKDYRGHDFQGAIRRWVLALMGCAFGMGGQWMMVIGAGFGLPLVEWLPLFLILPSIASALVMAEREEGVLSNLGVTLLTGRDLAVGKLRALMRLILPFLVGDLIGRILIIAAIPAGVFGVSSPILTGVGSLVLGLAESALCAGIIGTLSLYAASIRQSGPAATIAAYATVGILWFMVSTVTTMVSTVWMMTMESFLFYMLTARVLKYGVLAAIAYGLFNAMSGNYRKALLAQR